VPRLEQTNHLAGSHAFAGGYEGNNRLYGGEYLPRSHCDDGAIDDDSCEVDDSTGDSAYLYAVLRSAEIDPAMACAVGRGWCDERSHYPAWRSNRPHPAINHRRG